MSSSFSSSLQRRGDAYFASMLRVGRPVPRLAGRSTTTSVQASRRQQKEHRRPSSSTQRQQNQQQRTASMTYTTNPAAFIIPSELAENDDWLRLTVDLPGVLLRDLNVSVQHGILEIKGARKTFSVDGRVCTKKHKFSRRFAIDTDVVDIARLEANLVHGVLTVLAPKKSAQPVHMEIKVTQNLPAVEADGAEDGSLVVHKETSAVIDQPQVTTAATLLSSPASHSVAGPPMNEEAGDTSPGVAVLGEVVRSNLVDQDEPPPPPEPVTSAAFFSLETGSSSIPEE